MLLTTTIQQSWNARNKKWYVEKGYPFSAMGMKFCLKVIDLPDGSNVEVEIKCDYCKKVYSKPWYRYIRENRDSEVHTDCCIDCRKHKISDTAMAKYGVTNVLLLPEVKEKVKITNIERYGVENPFGSEEVQKKIYATNLMRYGVKSPMQSTLIQRKTMRTCQDKYGVPYYICNYHKTGADNHKWKGGVAFHRAERSTSEYITWRRRVFERDDYTCRKCGRRSRSGTAVFLNAHHINNWKDNVSLRYDVDNGITLCKDCHIEFHRLFGKSHTTKFQLFNFLKDHGKKIC